MTELLIERVHHLSPALQRSCFTACFGIRLVYHPNQFIDPIADSIQVGSASL